MRHGAHGHLLASLKTLSYQLAYSILALPLRSAPSSKKRWSCVMKCAGMRPRS